MAKQWRNRVHLNDETRWGTVEETFFDEDKKTEAKKDHAEKKLKLKKDEMASSHLCPHAPGAPVEAGLYNCRYDPRAEYEEFTKKTDDPLPPPAGP
jgi:hypothetical protein